jgi:hypothetical protein
MAEMPGGKRRIGPFTTARVATKRAERALNRTRPLMLVHSTGPESSFFTSIL